MIEMTEQYVKEMRKEAGQLREQLLDLRAVKKAGVISEQEQIELGLKLCLAASQRAVSWCLLTLFHHHFDQYDK